MTPDAQAILESWSAPVGVNVSMFLTVLIYTKGWLHLHKTFPNLISAWRFAAFFAGIISLSIAVGIPQAMARGIVGPFLRWSLVKRLARFISNPAICWLAAALALIGWHIPVVFELALRSHSWHELEHATFFGTGLLFWWPVVQPWPSTARWARWSIPLYLFCATLPCDALSGFLTFCDRVVYTSYLSAPQILTASPLQDQEFAAALMWVSVTIIFLVPAVVVTIQILSPGSANLPAQPWPALNRIAGQPLDASKSEVT